MQTVAESPLRNNNYAHRILNTKPSKIFIISNIICSSSKIYCHSVCHSKGQKEGVKWGQFQSVEILVKKKDAISFDFRIF